MKDETRLQLNIDQQMFNQIIIFSGKWQMLSLKADTIYF